MFSIYTPVGRAFHGPLEELRRVEKLPAFKKTSARYAVQESDIENEQAREFMLPSTAISDYQNLLENAGHREPVLHAFQIMSKNVKVLLEDSTLQQAVQIFQRYPFQLLPIVTHEGTLLGSLARRSLYEHMLEAEPGSAEDEKSVVETFLSQDSFVYSADPVTEVRRIASVLVENMLDALAVTLDSGKLVGIVSRTDLLRCIVADPPLSLWC